MADDVTKEIDSKLKESQKQASDQIDKRLDIVTAAAESQQKEVTADINRHAEFLTNFMEQTVQATTVGIANSMSGAGEKIEQVQKKGGIARSVARGMGKFGKFGARQTLGRVMFKEKLGQWGKGPTDEEKGAEKQRAEETKRNEVNEQINTQIVKNTSLLGILKYMNEFLMDIDSAITVMARESVKPRKFAEEIEREKRVREMKMMAIQQRMMEAMETLKDKDPIALDGKKRIDWDEKSFKFMLGRYVVKFLGALAVIPAAVVISTMELGLEGWAGSYIQGFRNIGKLLQAKLWTPLSKGISQATKAIGTRLEGGRISKTITSLGNFHERMFGAKGLLGGGKIANALSKTGQMIKASPSGLFKGVTKFSRWVGTIGPWLGEMSLLSADSSIAGRGIKALTSPIRLFQKIRGFIRGMPRLAGFMRTASAWMTPIMAFGEGFMGAFKGFKEGETVMGVDYEKGTAGSTFFGFAQGFQHGAIGWAYSLATDIWGGGQQILGNALSWIGVKTNWAQKGKELADREWRGKGGLHEDFNKLLGSIFVDPFANAFFWMREQAKGVKRVAKRMKKKGWVQVISETIVNIMSMIPIVGTRMSQFWAKKMGLNWEEVMIGDKAANASAARREKERTKAARIGWKEGYGKEFKEQNKAQFGQSAMEWRRTLQKSSDPAMQELSSRENLGTLMSLISTYDTSKGASRDDVYNFKFAKQQKRITEFVNKDRKTGADLYRGSMDNQQATRATTVQPPPVQVIAPTNYNTTTQHSPTHTIVPKTQTNELDIGFQGLQTQPQ